MTQTPGHARHLSPYFWLVGAAIAALLVLPAFAHAAVGAVTEFSKGVTANSAPQSITTGPDGNLWFTESASNKIGRITPAGVVTEFSNGLSAGANPWGITSGPDGNLWFTERSTSKIGRITPQGVITEFATITSRGESGAGPLIRARSACGAGGGSRAALLEEMRMPNPAVRCG